jgi:hypothetical protein
MKMIFRLVAIAFVFVNIIGSASAVDPISLAGIFAVMSASASNASTTLNVNQLVTDVTHVFKGASPGGAMITNMGTDAITVTVCNDVLACVKAPIHIGSGSTMPVIKTNFPFSSNRLSVKINGNHNFLQEGQYYHYATSNGLNSKGTIAGWSAAAGHSRRRLLKKH